MGQLILKALVRALFIFLPVAYWSLSKDASAQQTNNLPPVAVGLIVLLAFVLIMGLVLWATSRVTVNVHKPTNATSNGSMVEQDH
jgi:protein-S-isoprenylcysteine O-methyltransferase Ste14